MKCGCYGGGGLKSCAPSSLLVVEGKVGRRNNTCCGWKKDGMVSHLSVKVTGKQKVSVVGRRAHMHALE